MHVTIYTDGAADPNPGYGGWAAVLISGGREKILTGSEPDTTNNRMELAAAIEALRALNLPCDVDLYTDSSYVQRGITEWIGKWAARGWQRKGGDIANLELWQALHALNGQHRVTWHWVRGHAGDPLNERVDQLAREARLAIAPKSADSADLVCCWLRISMAGTTGGWGILLQDGDESRQFSGSLTHTTSNRLDLHAALEALRLTSADQPVLLCTAADYLFQGATRWLPAWKRQGWRKKDGGPVANADLWEALDRAMAGRPVRWQPLKGENSAEMAIALRLATAARHSA